MKRWYHLFWLLLMACNASPEKMEVLAAGFYKGDLIRTDGNRIPLLFEITDSLDTKIMHVINGKERLRVDEIAISKDTVLLVMPFFDSYFSLIQSRPGYLEGYWIRQLAEREDSIAFEATHGIREHIRAKNNPKFNISGRWDTWFHTPGSADSTRAIGLFQQRSGKIEGTFLTNTGDYRFLSGVVDGDTLRLSTFNGGQAYLFTAKINSVQELTSGVFLAGAAGMRYFGATRNDTVRLPDPSTLVSLNDSLQELNFTFPDLSGQPVSIKDPRFQDKVVIIQISGSWCPNCMDETAFLSPWYKENKSRGIEVVMLSYERSAEFEKASKAAAHFANRFHINYPVLITGVTPSDPQKAMKTVPQISDIKAFPTTIILDKKGQIRKIHTGFDGPSTGEHYNAYKRTFNQFIDSLIAE